VPQDGRFVRIIGDKIDQKVDIWILTHRDLVNVRRIRALLDFTYEKFRKDKDFLENGPSQS